MERDALDCTKECRPAKGTDESFEYTKGCKSTQRDRGSLACTNGSIHKGRDESLDCTKGSIHKGRDESLDCTKDSKSTQMDRLN